MDTRTPSPASETADTGRVEVDDAEAALVEHYGRLVRIAYVTLPVSMSRQRRVLLAHRAVQRALPRQGREVTVPGPGGAGPAYALVRERALRSALGYGRQRAGWRRWALAAAVAAPMPPQVVGLRLFPRSIGAGEQALDRVLAELDAPARAACALLGVEHLTPDDAATVLAGAGVADPGEALRAAAAATREAKVTPPAGEFDPCVLHARPTDLARRRQHVRASAAVAGTVALALALLGVPGGTGGGSAASGTPAAPGTAAGALDPASVVRVGPTAWLSSDRLGFAAWPARGGRTTDRGLIAGALAAWARPGSGVRVSATAGTARTGPPAPPHLLFAGDVDGTGVVVFYDGSRLVRYTRALGGGRPAALDFARVDTADGPSASAVVLSRADGDARYLTAPWIAAVGLRDLFAPGDPVQPVRRAADGVTSPVPGPARGPGCGSTPAGGRAAGWPAVLLSPRRGLADARPFLLTDLDDLAPVHLTYAVGAGARRVEATGPEALAAWAHTSCRLAMLRGGGVRAVSTWGFADQSLPDGAGVGRWLCTRADTWSGDDRVLLQFLPPASTTHSPAAVSAVAGSTPACGPMDPAVLSGVLWKSPVNRWYVLAAGSPQVASVDVSGQVRRASPTSTLAAPATSTTRAVLTARLTDGRTLRALK